MSHKNFGHKSSKPESHDEKKTTSSQHSKDLHVIVNKLDKQIDEMINELKNFKEYAWESASEFQRYKKKIASLFFLILIDFNITLFKP